MDFDVVRTNGVMFRGSIVQNNVLEKCVKHFNPSQIKEYQKLLTIAGRTNDYRTFEAYERTEMTRTKRQLLYNHYIGIRDQKLHTKYGEELVGKSSKKGNTVISWKYVDAVLNPLRKLYTNLPEPKV